MARWAIGDVQGCCEEFEQLLTRIRFNVDRDQLWLVGDLVNRGPCSLRVLRRVRDLADNAIAVLGNHDLHLLAVALAGERLRRDDTLTEILAAPDRDGLIQWLLARPLAYAQDDDLLVHAGVVPQWTVAQVLTLASEVERLLRSDPRALFAQMYSDQPDVWDEDLKSIDRARFTINVLTRLRFCTAEGRIDLKQKGKPSSARSPWMPWFRTFARASRENRIVFGHWSALGYLSEANLLALDTGCVWGRALTAVNLDDRQAPPVSVPSRQSKSNEE